MIDSSYLLEMREEDKTGDFAPRRLKPFLLFLNMEVVTVT